MGAFKHLFLYFHLNFKFELTPVNIFLTYISQNGLKYSGINSIELADLVMICEEQYDLIIEDESLSSFITVGDVVNYLETLN